jgi:hypothetical protein
MQLIKYEAARKALAEAHSIDEVKTIKDKAAALQLYARQAKDTELEFYAAEIRVRAERKAGEMLRDKDSRAKPGQYQQESSPVTLAELNISKNESSQWQRLASVPEEVFEEKINKAKESDKPLFIREVLRKKEVVPFSGEYEWYTPHEYMELVRKVLRHIGLDPASNAVANEYVKAERFYTIEDNGLEQEWDGTVFCNPPYCMPEIEKFAEKFLSCEEGIFLANNSTDTNWWQSLAKQCLISFPSRRISFIAPDGKTRSQPLRGQCFFYKGGNEKGFKQVFSDIGIVCDT